MGLFRKTNRAISGAPSDRASQKIQHSQPPRNSPTPASSRQPSTPKSREDSSRRPEAPKPQFAPADIIKYASRPGKTTGFEPKVLVDYMPPISINVHGAAGFGLGGTRHMGSNQIFSGQMGEILFLKALTKEKIIDSFSSYWSVGMPEYTGSGNPDAKTQADVDCIIVHGNELWLIDLKYYSGGDLTWHTHDGTWLLCRDNKTGKQIGTPRKMSKNMAMAVSRFQRTFPNHSIRACVCLIPTDRGIGSIAAGTEWPGGVPFVPLTDVLANLRYAAPVKADPTTHRILQGLLKD